MRFAAGPRLFSALLFLLPTLPACSYSFVNRYREPDIDCTSSYRWPLVDAAFALAATAATVYLATAPTDDMPADAPGTAGAAGVTSLTALVYGTSALYGAWHVGICRDEKRRAE